MAEFRMPSLGADMEAGTLVEWRVAAGDPVRRGQIVAVVETDKGIIDVEIWQDGVVEEIRVPVGEKVPVGTVLALIREAAGAPAQASRPGEAPAPAAPSPIPAAGPSVLPPAGPVAAGRVRASPAARARAGELGLDIAAVHGTGPSGAVTLEDVERMARQPSTAPVRQAIGAAMARSKREIPHYYLGTDIDLSRALSWLAAENQRRSVKERLLPVALLLKAVALAARDVPAMNGYFVDGVFRAAAPVHLGIAIALRQGGLVAPALHDADRKDLGTLMRDLDDLVERTRRGGLRSSELADATITVTNLGDLGVGTVYGVIYPPQVALVGFGRIAERPWVVEGGVQARPVVSATLSADHRASDGLRGARFLAAIDRALQAPETL